ncbi:MAG: formylglycine-generating enzyme family protein, partial [Treponema sp.]|nr:formylglycine-generating enzyme family protein [Treponema sp.]
VPGLQIQMLKTEVTQTLYKGVIGQNPSKYIGGEFPVEQVSWYDAIYFCNKLSMIMGLTPAYSVNGVTDPEKWNYTPHERDGVSGTVSCNYSVNGFRLPTEAEWEMAARGGVNGGWDYKYSGSNRTDDVAWYYYNSDYTHEVGKKQANTLGLYDMSGNVWEWCDNYYSSSSSYRTYRGGSINSGSNDCEVSYRSYGYPYDRFGFLGFRVACTAF